MVERDNHARSSGFLDVARFPEVRFRSREILVRDEGRHLTVVGDLTIRDRTREVRVEAVREGSAPLRAPAATIAFVGRATIRRQDFGLRWHEELERGGGLLAGDQIDIDLRIEARRGP